MKNYRVESVDRISKIPKKNYDKIHDLKENFTPFTKWEFLVAMEKTRCTNFETGWIPKPTLIYDDNQNLCAIVPMYEKLHSYGEYIFDWSWANAYNRYGKNYYPKLVLASPFTPVPGARIICQKDQILKDIFDTLSKCSDKNNYSSIHLLFGTDNELRTAVDSGWLKRSGIQFHWKNNNYKSFDDFLNNLSQKKRKKIRAERRKISLLNITCDFYVGKEISDEHLDFFCKCYEKTYWDHGNPPYLNRDFFFTIVEKMPENIGICIAQDNESKKLLASSLIMLGQVETTTTAYGRYWGAVEHIPFLHFEVSYYFPIEWAIKNGISRFEGGAQGEHKMARGFEPISTGSAHWFKDPKFGEAVKHFLTMETAGVENYLTELNDRNPFKT